MKSSKKIRVVVFLAVLFLLFPPLYAGWQRCLDNNEAMLPHLLNDSDLINTKYDSRVFVTTNSGDNWRNITVRISSYFYGYSTDKTDVNKEAFYNSVITKEDDTINNSSLKGLSSGTDMIENEYSGNHSDISAAEVISYLVKITKYVKYKISNIDGKKSVKVSREKLTQGVYNLKLNGSGFVKTFNYYKMESENGTFKKEWFS